MKTVQDEIEENFTLLNDTKTKNDLHIFKNQTTSQKCENVHYILIIKRSSAHMLEKNHVKGQRDFMLQLLQFMEKEGEFKYFLRDSLYFF
jgi:hypothetical protein